MKSKAVLYARITALSFVVIMIVSLLPATGLQSAHVSAQTPVEIESTIAAGISWLAKQQSGDGSWPGSYPTARTCLALVKLQEWALNSGHTSPFDSYYEYSDEIKSGWEYLFARTQQQSPLPAQDHTGGASGRMDDPDTNRNGYGIYFPGEGRANYSTGICAMALTSDGISDVPNNLGLDFNDNGSPDTFAEFTQDVVDWLAFSQTDSGYGEGGWDYYNWHDNSGSRSDSLTSGFVVLGLSSAENAGHTIPAWVKTELDKWVDQIQCTDGGSGHIVSCFGVNELRTSSLILQMTFVGDNPSAPRLQNALDYVESHWRDRDNDPGWGYGQHPASYQTMYSLRKSLDYSGVDLIDSDGDGIRDDDWYSQNSPASPAPTLASVIIAQQNTDGSWPGRCRYGDSVMCSTWALLTLEKVQPPTPQPDLWPVEYVPGDPAPGESWDRWPIFEAWLNVRIENRGNGDAFNVTATVTGALANTTVPDPDVSVGDIPSFDSVWSGDTFTTHVDMANPVDPCQGGLTWRIEYDDAAGVHHVIDGIPQFPPGECPCGL